MVDVISFVRIMSEPPYVVMCGIPGAPPPPAPPPPLAPRARYRTGCLTPTINDLSPVARYVYNCLGSSIAFVHYRVASMKLSPIIVGVYDFRAAVPIRCRFRPVLIQQTPLFCLPTDMIQTVLSYIEYEQLFPLLLVCKHLHFHASNERVHENAVRSKDHVAHADLIFCGSVQWFDYASTFLRHGVSCVQVLKDPFECLVRTLRIEMCSYVVLDMALVCKIRSHGLMFMHWASSGAPSVDRVQHAVCRGAARRLLICTADHQATDLSEAVQLEVASRVPRRFRL